MIEDEIEDPCVMDCVMGVDPRYCLGCGRTYEEITSWRQLTYVDRKKVLERLEKINLRVKE